MKRTLLVVLGALALAACESNGAGPSLPTPTPSPPPPPSDSVFRPQDFSWSTAAGHGALDGTMTYKVGSMKYTCKGGDVVMTPETPWSRRRMSILYGSPSNAAVPVSTVRARTPSAPSGDYASFIRKTTCDAANHFAFSGLPDGGWFVITLAKPLSGPGEAVAVMRRVETHGASRSITLN